MDYLLNQIKISKLINIWRPILQLIDKIMQSGNINSSNYVTLTEKIFFISDTIYSNCKELLSKLELKNSHYQFALKEIFDQNLEPKKFKCDNYPIFEISYKVLFFWYIYI